MSSCGPRQRAKFISPSHHRHMGLSSQRHSWRAIWPVEGVSLGAVGGGDLCGVARLLSPLADVRLPAVPGAGTEWAKSWRTVREVGGQTHSACTNFGTSPWTEIRAPRAADALLIISHDFIPPARDYQTPGTNLHRT
jgi:hypothetical protein